MRQKVASLKIRKSISPVRLLDPLGDRPLERRASMLALHLRANRSRQHWKSKSRALDLAFLFFAGRLALRRHSPATKG